MSQQELQDALSSVREHFAGVQVNANTVLAAHMRAQNVHPSGEAWEVAKEALESGLSFAEAASRAKTMESNRAIGSYARAQGGGADQESARDVRLSWYPKMFSPGDLDGQGARRLLGQPHDVQVAVLVRETAQNSWDARLPGESVTFELRLRRLGDEVRKLLRDRVFTGACEGLGLRTALEGEELWALEVLDRGTTGLGGPIRNDIAVPDGVPTDFIDFVMNVGAPRDTPLGGGTYGFGKTISYVVSGVGSQLIWSRTREGATLEDRLIGSGIGRSFEANGYRYTGRHWWGIERDEGSRIEPLTASSAGALASPIFERDFREEETGTSLLILDPQLGGATREQDAQRLAESVLWHLWPKTTPNHHGWRGMNIRVFFEGEEVPVPSAARHSVLCGYTEALQTVRAVQAGEEYESSLPTHVQELWCHRPKKLLGHIAFTTYPMRGESHTADPDDPAPIHGWSRHVALMRHEAELVVKYDERSPLEIDGFQWAAVFKPVREVDDAYSKSEPPAHDDWIPQSIQDKAKRRDVNVGLTRITEAVAEFLGPRPTGDPSDESVASAAALGDALADLVASLEGPRPTTGAAGGGGAGRSLRPTATVDRGRLGPVGEDGRRLAGVQFSTSHPDGRHVRVVAKLHVAYDGGRQDATGLAAVIGWTEEQPDFENAMEGLKSPDVIELGSSSSGWLVLDVSADLAFDVVLSAEEADA